MNNSDSEASLCFTVLYSGYRFPLLLFISTKDCTIVCRSYDDMAIMLCTNDTREVNIKQF